MNRLTRVVLLLTAIAVSTPSLAAADPAGTTSSRLRFDDASIGISGFHGCAVIEDGTVRCWGSSKDGELGQGNDFDIGDDLGEVPVVVPLPPGSVVTQLATGWSSNCAILGDGSVRCWGSGAGGQLAQGDSLNHGDAPGPATVAVPLPAGRTAVQLATQRSHTCALLDDATIRCWGVNFFGEFGIGNTNAIGDQPGELPVEFPLPAGRTAKSVAVGGANICALLDDDSVRCAGSGATGQLVRGVATIGDQPGETTVEFPLPTGRKAQGVAIASENEGGAGTICVILDDGTVRCAGQSIDGELAQGNALAIGDGKFEVPVKIPLPADHLVVALDAHANADDGGSTLCAILDDASLWCWGYNHFGNLGQGNTDAVGNDPFEKPVQVELPAGRSALAVAVGPYTTCALLDNRSVLCWGWARHGLLGNGQTSYGTTDAYGDEPTELPRLFAVVPVGDLKVGVDRDRDGLRDAVDACPTQAGATSDGCPVPAAVATPTPGPTPAPPPSPSPAPKPVLTPLELIVNGRKVTIDALVKPRKSARRCPARATAAAGTGRQRRRGSLSVRAAKTATGQLRCRVTGTLTLAKQPPAKSRVRVTVSGAGLTTRTITLKT